MYKTNYKSFLSLSRLPVCSHKLFLRFYDVFLLRISSRTRTEKHSIRQELILYYANKRICVERAVDVFVSCLRNKDALVSSSRRHRMKNRAKSAAEWPNITIFCFPSTISSFLVFLLLFLYRLFQHLLKNRDCSLSRCDSRVDDEAAL